MKQGVLCCLTCLWYIYNFSRRDGFTSQPGSWRWIFEAAIPVAVDSLAIVAVVTSALASWSAGHSLLCAGEGIVAAAVTAARVTRRAPRAIERRGWMVDSTALAVLLLSAFGGSVWPVCTALVMRSRLLRGCAGTSASMLYLLAAGVAFAAVPHQTVALALWRAGPRAAWEVLDIRRPFAAEALFAAALVTLELLPRRRRRRRTAAAAAFTASEIPPSRRRVARPEAIVQETLCGTGGIQGLPKEPLYRDADGDIGNDFIVIEADGRPKRPSEIKRVD